MSAKACSRPLRRMGACHEVSTSIAGSAARRLPESFRAPGERASGIGGVGRALVRIETVTQSNVANAAETAAAAGEIRDYPQTRG